MPTYEEYLEMADRADRAGDAQAAKDLMSLASEAKPAAQPAPTQPASPPTLQQRAQEVYGFDPNIEKRGTILPFGRTKEGKLELAVPQVGVDLATSFLLPGHVAQGGSYTPEDATKFTLDYLAPATAHRFPTGKRAAPPARKDLIATAPSTEDLLTKGSAKFEAAKRSGAKLGGDRYLDFMAKLETKLADEGVDPVAPKLHPNIHDVVKSMTKRIGNDVDIGDLQTIRRQMGIAANTTAKELSDERRIAGDMIKMIDDVVEQELAEPRYKEARELWRAGRKAQEIEQIIEKATRQASGFENGLRIGFRNLLNDKKRLRGFTATEIAVMKEIEKGTPTQQALRWLSKLGPNRSGSSGFLGTAVGSYGGASALGAPGAVAIPAAGYAAGTAAERSVMTAADYLRALAATGGKAPPKAPSRLADITVGSGFPLAGTGLPVMTQSKEDQEKLRRLLMEPRS